MKKPMVWWRRWWWEVLVVVVAVVAVVPGGLVLQAEAVLLERLTATGLDLSSSIPKPCEAMFRYCTYVGNPEWPIPIYSQGLSDGRIVAGWCDGTSAHVSFVTFDAGGTPSIQHDWTTAGLQIRGLYVQDDFSSAVLVRRGATCAYCGPPDECAPCQDLTFVSFDSSGSVTAETVIDNRIYDFSLGSSHLSWGNDQYAAYYKVHSIEEMCVDLPSGHEGDALKFFPTSGPPAFNPTASVNSPGWCWGCSHSMDERLVYNPTLEKFGIVCLTDAYPSPPGIYFNDATQIYAVEGGADGYTNGGLGGLVSTSTGWLLTFTAPRPGETIASKGTDVGFVALDSSGNPGTVVWLTDTDGVNEQASHLAAYGSNYLVTWSEVGTTTTTYYVAEITSSGEFVNDAEDITSVAIFGERMDFFNYDNGDVGWIFSWPGSTPTPNYSPTSKLYIMRVKCEKDAAPSNNEDSKGLSAGAKAGIAVVIIVLFFVGIAGILFFLYRKGKLPERFTRNVHRPTKTSSNMALTSPSTTTNDGGGGSSRDLAPSRPTPYGGSQKPLPTPGANGVAPPPKPAVKLPPKPSLPPKSPAVPPRIPPS